MNAINPFVQQSVGWLEQLHGLLILYPALAWALVLTIGLASGSFLGCLIYRLPIILVAEWKEQARALLADDWRNHELQFKTPELSLWRPGSFCPSCRHPVGLPGLIPLLGYMLLRGRCRHCRAPIDISYPLLELAGVFVAVWCYANFGFSWMGLFLWYFSLAALALAWVDAKSTLLPDQLLTPLLVVGLIVNYFALFTPFASSFWGCVGAYLLFALVASLARLILRREALGWGDVKLLAALAAWSGWETLPLLLFMATTSALIFLFVRLLISGISLRQPMPFGPFLLGSGWLIMQAQHLLGFNAVWL